MLKIYCVHVTVERDKLEFLMLGERNGKKYESAFVTINDELAIPSIVKNINQGIKEYLDLEG